MADRLISLIKKKILKVNLKNVNTMNEQLIQKEILMTNKHLMRFSPSPVMEMPNKASFFIAHIGST